MLSSNTIKYPSEILEGLKQALRKELDGARSDDALNEQILSMTKIEIMDKYFESNHKKITSDEICKIVSALFGFNLDNVLILTKDIDVELELVSPAEPTLARKLISSYLNQEDKVITGKEIRTLINDIFGINLEGISSLEGAGISLFSKGQWVLQQEKDLFVVHTGTGDVEVKIFPTRYFTEQTGLASLPVNLINALTEIGYSFDEKLGGCTYTNPTGEAVTDSFKGQTIGATIQEIRQSYPKG
ncbi:hypothetical protein [Neobacillus sp. LXY-4]|uniref:hypothetical protein n=1 Tax=Neobacillus sp. LXY-4 TaxID=3379826 RepID=UPI003EE07F60